MHEKIGSSLLRAKQGLLVAPATNRLVIAAAQHRWHFNAAKHRRSGVHWSRQQAILERIVERTFGIADCAGNESHDRIDEHGSGKFTAADDVVADGNLARDERVANALIDAFVASGEHDDIPLERQLVDH